MSFSCFWIVMLTFCVKLTLTMLTQWHDLRLHKKALNLILKKNSQGLGYFFLLQSNSQNKVECRELWDSNFVQRCKPTACLYNLGNKMVDYELKTIFWNAIGKPEVPLVGEAVEQVNQSSKRMFQYRV